MEDSVRKGFKKSRNGVHRANLPEILKIFVRWLVAKIMSNVYNKHIRINI